MFYWKPESAHEYGVLYPIQYIFEADLIPSVIGNRDKSVSIKQSRFCMPVLHQRVWIAAAVLLHYLAFVITEMFCLCTR